MALKDWKQKTFAGELAWENIKTGELITLYLQGGWFLTRKEAEKEGKFSMFLYDKGRQNRIYLYSLGTKAGAIASAKKYMRTH